MWISLNEKGEHMDSSNKKGLHLRFYKDVDPNIKRSCKEFCKWLRTLYWFPIRCNIRFLNKTYIKNEGKKYLSIFCYSESDEDKIMPFIYIATGNYEKDILKNDVDNVLASYLFDIVHELTHYYQWYFLELESDKRTNRSIENEATRWANYLLNEYKKVKKHP